MSSMRSTFLTLSKAKPENLVLAAKSYGSPLVGLNPLVQYSGDAPTSRLWARGGEQSCPLCLKRWSSVN